MRRRTWLAAAFSLALALGAAPLGAASKGEKVTDKEIADVELAIRSAENAAATENARGSLDKARAALTAAQNQRVKKNHERARAFLDEARASAAAAESEAKARQLLQRQASVKQKNDELEGRIRSFDRPGERP
ncbi:MAG TPA: hypothetical protein VGR00_13355 [Thermoanaerobaculia bacterium]|nr:hypothetical protein [Thermoanaerobaculia bacterium]